MVFPTSFRQIAIRSMGIFLVKIISFLIRIPLFRLLGVEGAGLYQMIYTLNGLIVMIITGGFPTTLSLIVAKDRKLGWDIFRTVSVFLALLGGTCGLVIFTFAPQIALFYGNDDFRFAIRCIALTVLVIPMLSLTRGFFQGIEWFGMIVLSEVIEQAIGALTMIVLVTLWMKRGVDYAVGGTITGAFLGGFTALLSLWTILIFFYVGKHQPTLTLDSKSLRVRDRGATIVSFFKTSFFISAAQFILPFSEFLDALMIPQRLQVSGLNVHQAISVLGIITGMGSIIAYMPTVVTSAVSFVLSPKITADWQQAKHEQFLWRSRRAIEIGWLWGMGSAVFLFLNAHDLSMYIFGNDSAAIAIRYQCVAPIIAGMREITTTILWSMEKKKEPFAGLLIGVFCSFLLNYHLAAIPGFGFEGAAIGVLSVECVALLWNLQVLRRYNKQLSSFLPLLPELLFFSLFAVMCFYLLNSLQVSLSLSHFMFTLGRLLVTYTCIALYIFIRFLKGSRLRIFIW